jgi:hypothetical protein
VILLAGAGLAAAAAASDRYKPTDPGTLLLQLGPRMAPAVSLEEEVEGLLERSRAEGDPRLAGRAEAMLAAPLGSRRVSTRILIAQADILQQRHDFGAALRMLDRALAGDPGNARARLMRAQLHLVRGHFALARPDCAAVIAAGEAAVGYACLAQAGAATGDPRAFRLGELAVAGSTRLDPERAAWAHGVRAELAQRRDESQAAEMSLRVAIAVLPRAEFARVALADLLLARGAAGDALPLLDLERPSVGVLVRRVIALEALGRASREPRERLRDLLSLAALRGERAHLREEALLALDVEHDPVRALALAERNFEIQKELPDVRLYARAAIAARSAVAIRALRAWVSATGYRDAVVERWLA